MTLPSLSVLESEREKLAKELQDITDPLQDITDPLLDIYVGGEGDEAASGSVLESERERLAKELQDIKDRARATFINASQMFDPRFAASQPSQSISHY